MEWLLLLIVVALAIYASRTRGLLTELNQRLEQQEQQLRHLTLRVYTLESSPATPATQVAQPELQPQAQPEPPPEPLPAIEPEPVFAAAALPLAVPQPEAAEATPPLPQPEPAPVAHRLPDRKKQADWEAVIGGSWLQALGILITVIGLALLLGLSLTTLGPAGKIAVGLAASLATLAAGVRVEKKERYRLFGRGLIGGGWAALYFTTYAMHGLDAARVIDSPTLGFLLLLIVTVGMIAHSLRYSSERLTTLAYLIAFITLHFTSLTGFAIAASIPLAASLLFISRRFHWTSMAVIGLILSYGTFALRYDPATASLAYAQAALWLYWLVFESFDWSELLNADRRGGVINTILPLNACGLVGVSVLVCRFTQAQLGWFLTAAASAYLADTLLRYRYQTAEARSRALYQRLTGSGYEPAILVASLLAAAASIQQFTEWRVAFALALNAQLIVLAGLRLGDRFLTRWGGLLFPFAVGRLLIVDAWEPGRAWVVVAALLAALFYLNRGLTREAPIYTYAATGLLTVLLGNQLPTAWFGKAWLLLGAIVWEAGLQIRLRELRYQGYIVATLGIVVTAAIHLLGLVPHPPFWALLPAALVGFAGMLRARRAGPELLPPSEATPVIHTTAFVGTVLSGLFFWRWLPAPLIAPAWGLTSLALLEAGRLTTNSALLWNGHWMAGASFLRLFLANFTITTQSYGISHRLLTVTPFVALFRHLASQFAAQAPERAYSLAATIVATVLLRFELGRSLTVAGWAALLLVLLYFGLRLHKQDLRWHAYGIAILTFVRAWATNFFIPDNLLGLPIRVATGLFVIAAFYAAEFLLPREADQRPDRYARPAFSLLASILFGVLLFFEVSGRVLTVAWAFQGIALLAAGFTFRERSLRLSGLVLFLFCVLKLLTYDLRSLDTISRTISFLVLGLVLVGASWIYTRFRDQIQKFL